MPVMNAEDVREAAVARRHWDIQEAVMRPVLVAKEDHVRGEPVIATAGAPLSPAGPVGREYTKHQAKTAAASPPARPPKGRVAVAGANDGE